MNLFISVRLYDHKYANFVVGDDKVGIMTTLGFQSGNNSVIHYLPGWESIVSV